MAFTPKTEDELRIEGYEPTNAVDAAKLRAYGVPVVQKGLMSFGGSRFKFWVPGWAKRLLVEWPLDPRAPDGDYDHFTLKSVVRLLARTGRADRVDEFLTVARLGGEQAVRQMLEAPPEGE